MEKDFLKNVYGYNDIKEELFFIRNIILEHNQTNKQYPYLPKGMLFYGNPGQGKTLIVREYSKTFNYPIFIIEGNSDDVCSEVSDIFKKAKNEKKAIIIIDELDKLILNNNKITRLLMSEIDGYDKKGNFIVLSTCNNIFDIPESLLRSGRFDKQYYMEPVDEDDRTNIIESLLKEANVVLNNNDIQELVDIFEKTSISEIKAIINHAVFRHGTNCTVNDIFLMSIYYLKGYPRNSDKDDIEWNVAVHEAGHALFLYYDCKTLKFLRMFYHDDGGYTAYKKINNHYNKLYRTEYIYATLSGLVAEDLILKKHGTGCSNDLDKAYETSFRLVNRTCINGISNFLDYDHLTMRSNCSENKKYQMEKETTKYMLKAYKYVKKHLKKHRSEIISIAKYFQEHREVRRNVFEKLLNK